MQAAMQAGCRLGCMLGCILDSVVGGGERRGEERPGSARIGHEEGGSEAQRGKKAARQPIETNRRLTGYEPP